MQISVIHEIPVQPTTFDKMCRLQPSTLFTVSHNAMHFPLQFSTQMTLKLPQMDKSTLSQCLLLMFAHIRNINQGN